MYLLLFFITFFTSPVFSSEQKQDEFFLIRQKPSVHAEHYTLYDPETQTVLAAKNQHNKTEIASLTKLMSMYVVSDSLNKKFIKLDDTVKISHKAAAIGGSRMFTDEGSLVTVDSLMNGAIISSGNDATIALAEFIGGNEGSFVGIMNDYAKQLQLDNTHFDNSTGLDSKNHYSTSYDLAILASHIINDFPDDFYRYKNKFFTYNKIKQRNHNKLLWSDDNIDGLKTGYTKKAKYCLAATSSNADDGRLIAIVLGADNEHIRAEDAQALLRYGKRFFKHNSIPKEHVFTKLKVWYGNKYANIGLQNTLVYNVPVFNNEPVKADYQINVKKLVAPVKIGTVVGKLVIQQDQTTLSETPLIVTNDVKSQFWLFRFYDWAVLKYKKLFHKPLI